MIPWALTAGDASKLRLYNPFKLENNNGVSSIGPTYGDNPYNFNNKFIY
jgi:hypothetical protein